jgi:hypothetical protein
MDARFGLSEALAAATTTMVDENNGYLTFREADQKLLDDITTESKASAEFLIANPDHAHFTQGTVSMDAKLDRNWATSGKSLEEALVPQFNENVRMWPIPGTDKYLTDLETHDIVTIDSDDDHPHVISKYNIPTVIELEQLVVGLRALRN